MKTHYEVLGVSPFSEIEIIASAYRALMRKYEGGSDCEKDADRVREIREAYAILGDPNQRAEYDAFLARGHSTQLVLQAERKDHASPDAPSVQAEASNTDYLDSVYGIENSISDFFKNKKFLFGIAIIYIMFWPVLAGPNIFCDTCDHAYSLKQFVQEFHYPLMVIPIIAVPSAIISLMARHHVKLNPYYVFYITNIIASVALIRVIL